MPAPAQGLFVRGDGLRLSAQVWSRPERPTVVLVHGYPDDRTVWDAVAPLLAEDFQVVSYDVRGAGESEAPPGTAGYRLEHLVADLQAVIDAFSPSRPVHLVAHDWGSLQSWEAVTSERLRGRIASFTSICGPCLDHAAGWFRERLASGWAGRAQALGQMLRSWYMFFFQLPLLAPLGWRLVLARAWPGMLRRAEGLHIPPRPQQLRNGVNGIGLYRANFLERMLHPRERRAEVPVLLVVCRRDPYISTAVYDAVGRWVPQLRRVEIDSGHWLPLKQPQWLARQVRDLIRDLDPGAGSA